MAQQPHQGVDTDLGVGELGGECVAQPVNEGSTDTIRIDARAAKSTQRPILQGAARDSLRIRTDKQRRRWGARRPIPRAGEGRFFALVRKRAARLSRYPREPPLTVPRSGLDGPGRPCRERG